MERIKLTNDDLTNINTEALELFNTLSVPGANSHQFRAYCWTIAAFKVINKQRDFTNLILVSLEDELEEELLPKGKQT